MASNAKYLWGNVMIHLGIMHQKWGFYPSKMGTETCEMNHQRFAAPIDQWWGKI